MEQAENKKLLCKGTKIYFTKALERKIFFILTLIMLAWGIFSKLNLL